MIDYKAISLEDLAGHICETLRKEGIDAILVGGACVTIYACNRYVSYDLDFVTHAPRKDLKEVLHSLHFEEHNRYYKHQDCPWLIEFVNPPVAVGEEPITDFNYIKTRYGTIQLLQPIDSIKDRLASYFHWDDRQALDQALEIHKDHKINLDDLVEWAKKERCESKLADFVNSLDSSE